VVLDPFQGEENVGLDHLGASRVWGWIEKSYKGVVVRQWWPIISLSSETIRLQELLREGLI